MTNEQLVEQRGVAEVTVKLRGGHISVLHCETGKVLIERPAYEGDWDKLWLALEGKQ
jgi:hypothetical protein